MQLIRGVNATLWLYGQVCCGSHRISVENDAGEEDDDGGGGGGEASSAASSMIYSIITYPSMYCEHTITIIFIISLTLNNITNLSSSIVVDAVRMMKVVLDDLVAVAVMVVSMPIE